MKYYCLVKNEHEVNLPVVQGLNKTLNVLAFRRGETWKIGFRNILHVQERKELYRYPGILLDPLPLVHQSLFPIFSLHGFHGIYKYIVYLETARKKAEVYLLLQPLMLETTVRRQENQYQFSCEERNIQDLPIFYVLDQQKLYVICGLPVVEGLLRQGMNEVDFIEVNIEGRGKV